ncbi:MAG: pyridoxal-phosphate dependent enzyme [Burkholderiales bacterium]
MSREPALFRFLPKLASSTPWVRLADRTPVGQLTSAGKRRGHSQLFVKREDRTASLYGGNKVRNLEFILGDAIARKVSRILTVAPLGSNFVAALAAQASRVGLDVEVEHFVPARSPQIDTHANFSAAAGAKLSLHAGRRGAVAAAGAAALRLMTSEDTLWCAPGGSSVTGALGHLNAALGLVEQVRAGRAAKTRRHRGRRGNLRHDGGAYRRLAGCGTRHAARRRSLRRSHRLQRARDREACEWRSGAGGQRRRVLANEICLVNSPLDHGYGIPLGRAEELMASFEADEGIRLDTTYTSKVVSKLAELLTSGEFKGKNILYWHTFSPAAIQWGKGRVQEGFGFENS